MIATCPKCKNTLNVPDSNTNPSIECPVCHTVFLFLPPRRAANQPLQSIQQAHCPDAYAEMEKKSNRNKIIIWTLFILAVLIGGWYFTSSRKAEKIADRQKTIQDAQTSLWEFSAERTKVLAQLQTVQQKLKLAEDEREKKQEQKNKLRDQLSDLEDRMQDVQPAEPVSPEPPEHPDPESQIRETKNMIQKAETELTRLECHYRCYRTTNQKVQERYTDRKGNSRYRTRNYQSNRFVCPRHGYTWNDRMQYLDFSYQRGQQEQKIRTLKEKLQELNAQAAELQKKKTETVSPAKSAAMEFKNRKKAEQKALEKKLKQNEQRLQVLEELIEKYKTEEDSLSNRQDELNGEINSLKNTISRAEADLRRLNQ